MVRAPAKSGLLILCAGLAALAAMAVLYRFMPDAYHLLLTWMGVMTTPVPFVDADVVLRAADCQRQGINPYIDARCGYYGYAPTLLLGLRAIGAGAGWRYGFGLVQTCLFVCLIAWVAPQRRGTGILLLGLLSPAMAFAAERANLDLLMCEMIGLAALASTSSWGLRWGVAPLVMAAGLSKFYPFTALILILRGRLPLVATVACATAAALLAFVMAYRAELHLAAHNLPVHVLFSDMFGAGNLSYLILLCRENIPPDFALRWVWVALAGIFLAIILLRLRDCFHIVLDADARDAFTALDDRSKMLLVAACAIVTGCFFAGPSIGYRMIYVILAFPALIGLASTSTGRVAADHRRLLHALIFLLWSAALEHGANVFLAAVPAATQLLWLAREYVWWWVIARLLAFLVFFISDTPAWQAAHAVIGQKRPYSLAMTR